MKTHEGKTAYGTALALLLDARGFTRLSKKLKNNTYARLLEGEDGPEGVAVRLHDTDVVTIYEDGRVRLDTGGWDTLTTRDRMHTYAPEARVFRHQGVTRVHLLASGKTWRLVDGFEYLPHNGQLLTDPALLENADDRLRLERRAGRAVNAWLKAMTPEEAERVGNALVDGDLLGDCWYCLMTTEGKNLGDAVGGRHIVEHIEERYYVPSLFINAFQERYGDRAGVMAQSWVLGMTVGRPEAPARSHVKTMRDYMVPRMIEEGWE